MKLSLKRVLSSLLLTLLSISWTVAFSGASGAHTALVSSTPVDNSIIKEFPSKISLKFNEPLLTLGGQKSNYFELISPSGESLQLDEFMIDESRISAEVQGAIDLPGRYEISYRVVSSDGHVVKGAIRFQFISKSSPPEDGDEAAISVADESARVPVELVAGLIIIALFSGLWIYSRAKYDSEGLE